jgi:hypothetical protein
MNGKKITYENLKKIPLFFKEWAEVIAVITLVCLVWGIWENRVSNNIALEALRKSTTPYVKIIDFNMHDFEINKIFFVEFKNFSNLPALNFIYGFELDGLAIKSKAFNHMVVMPNEIVKIEITASQLFNILPNKEIKSILYLLNLNMAMY